MIQELQLYNDKIQFKDYSQLILNLVTRGLLANMFLCICKRNKSTSLDKGTMICAHTYITVYPIQEQ